MLQNIKDKYGACTACNLHVNRKCVVFGEGPLSPKIMLIGEGPGEHEAEEGRPFVGRAGQKLNEMIAWLGLSRSEVYISNSVLCRPPQNRQPTIEEVLACRGRLIEELHIVNPSLIVLLGRTALNAILGQETRRPLRDFMNNFLSVQMGDRSYNTAIVAHPAFHCYQPKAAWAMTKNNWLRIKEFVNDRH